MYKLHVFYWLLLCLNNSVRYVCIGKVNVIKILFHYQQTRIKTTHKATARDD